MDTAGAAACARGANEGATTLTSSAASKLSRISRLFMVPTLLGASLWSVSTGGVGTPDNVGPLIKDTALPTTLRQTYQRPLQARCTFFLGWYKYTRPGRTTVWRP